MLPHPTITRAFVARGARLWLAARLLVSGTVLLAGMNPLDLAWPAVLLVVAGSFALGALDVHRRHERVLLENLTISRTTVALFFLVPAAAGEIMIALAAALRG